jgi:hypothetical protein
MIISYFFVFPLKTKEEEEEEEDEENKIVLRCCKMQRKKSEKIVSHLCTKFLFPQTKQGVCHIVALPFILKKYLKAKEELWKFEYFTMQKYNLQKNPSKKKPKSFKIYYNSIITNLKFSTQAKISSSFKNPRIKKN